MQHELQHGPQQLQHGSQHEQHGQHISQQGQQGQHAMMDDQDEHFE